LVLLHGEDMLDARADLGLERIGAPRRLRHRPARRLLAVNAADEAVLCEEILVGLRAIGRIGPYRSRGVGFVEQALAQARAFGCGAASERALLVHHEGNEWKTTIFGRSRIIDGT